MKTPGVTKTAGVTKINVGSDFETDCAAAVMFARNAALSPPTLPPGVAERIIRDVPRLMHVHPCAPGLCAQQRRCALSPVHRCGSPLPVAGLSRAGRRWQRALRRLR